MMPVHFGINLRESKYGLSVSRELYAKIDNRSSLISGQIYSDEWCQKHFENCMINFDLNMKYFMSLDRHEFNNALDKFIKKTKKFIEVFDLNEYQYKSGYYMLVLDEFCQVYIGTSQDIKKRIMNHWSKQKQFDRLIFGSINNSIISIDSFRALDTTRIFVYQTNRIFSMENSYINKFPSKFLLNRTIGGKLDGGLKEAVKNGKNRVLLKGSTT